MPPGKSWFIAFDNWNQSQSKKECNHRSEWVKWCWTFTNSVKITTKKDFKIFPREISGSCWKIQFQNHPCGVVDNCGITGCGVWRRKIAFDPRFSTFETRYPDKGTNIKRHLTPGAPWPSAKGTKVWTQPRFTNKMLLCWLDIQERKQYKLYVVENVVLFLFP